MRGLGTALHGTSLWIDAGFSDVADCAFWLLLGATLVIGTESLAGIDDWVSIRGAFGESVLPKSFFEDSYVKRFLALSPTAQVVSMIAVLAGLVLIPYLGSVGLWDPWEVHYGEVARSMVQRGDYVYPYWENGWFFSKPAMTMWLMALGMNLVGANDTQSHLSLATEWGMRLPFVLLYTAGVQYLFSGKVKLTESSY